jgi:hypothetical protein
MRPPRKSAARKGERMVYRITAEADRKYIEEFRARPITAHRSPGLQRVLNVMRMYRGGDRHILIARRESRTTSSAACRRGARSRSSSRTT